MALFNTYSAENRVVSSDSVVSYTTSIVDTGVYMIYTYEYRRTRKKSYSYVGMNYETARRCAEAATAYYTRSKTVPKYSSEGFTIENVDAGSDLMAEISIQHRGGNMYDVVINVNESDVRASRYGTLDPAEEFDREIYNSRKYDTLQQAFG